MTNKERTEYKTLERRVIKLEQLPKRNADERDELIRCKRRMLLLANPDEPLHEAALWTDLHVSINKKHHHGMPKIDGCTYKL